MLQFFSCRAGMRYYKKAMKADEQMKDEEYLIRVENADVSLDGKGVLYNISWELKPGEQWAVIGRNGSGKSTFLKLLLGEVRPMPDRGRLIYRLDGEEQETPLGVREHIASVTPELQDTYVRNGWDMSGEEVIQSGFFHSVWLHEKPGRVLIAAADELMKGLGIEELREKSILAMSQGEARKILIARALLSRPAVLLLDEIGDGLDASSRQNILAVLEQTAKDGTRIVYATHRPEELIPSVSHVLLLRGGRIYSSGRRNGASPGLPPARKKRTDDRMTMPAVGMKPSRRRGGKGECLVRIENASVYIDNGRILDSINWRMKCGENWAVLGRNGSGKSTLLKMICGELHPAVGGKVEWFSGRGLESVWEIRKRIGCVSPELQALYDEDLTGEEVVLSGLFASRGLYRKVSGRQRAKVKGLIRTLGLERIGRKKVGQISYGEMRKLLIARALANNPDMLILDEPCSGLDMTSRDDFLGFIEAAARSGTGIVMATHHRDELIPSITHALLMDKGRVTGQGEREKVAGRPSLTAVV
jgi:molybdate transport system ATP-binding protein